jgi:hypothetical protein
MGKNGTQARACYHCYRAKAIATCYGLDGPGIESRCRRGFPRPSRQALEPTHPPIQLVSGFSRGKAAEAWG